MEFSWGEIMIKPLTNLVLVLFICVTVFGCGKDGADGDRGPQGDPGPAGPSVPIIQSITVTGIPAAP
jgi:hypothetical protein